MAAWRSYRCENPDCCWFHEPLTVRGKPLGHFYFWPELRCECGQAPLIIRSSLPTEHAALSAARPHRNEPERV